MAELERVDYQIYGDQREQALSRFNARLEEWGLKMPDVEPQVLDLGTGKFDEIGLIEYWVANNEKEGYCGKFLFVFDGQTCPYHHHDLKHETFFVMRGKVKMNVDGKESVMEPGAVLAMDQGSNHSFIGLGDALLLEISKPCKENDNIFPDKSIGVDGVM